MKYDVLHLMHTRSRGAFELTRIKRTFPNSPPNITTKELIGAEDNLLIASIDTFDFENDILIYELTREPQHAKCVIDKAGILNCTFEYDFYGSDEIAIKVTETNLPLYERPYSQEKTHSNFCQTCAR